MNRVFNVPKYRVTQTYTQHIQAVKNGGYAQGIDLVSQDENGKDNIKAQVIAHGDGVVIFAGGENSLGGYGNVVLISHKDGYVTGYGHLKNLLVKTGQIIKKGTLLGTIGTTGNSTGVHLHFEVRKYPKEMTPQMFAKNMWSGFSWIDCTKYVDNALPNKDYIPFKPIKNGIDYSLVFEPIWYADNHSDILKAYGHDKEKLFSHFLNYGMKERRMGSARFDPDSYAGRNIKNGGGDLIKAFGKNPISYYIHYIQYGYKEFANKVNPTRDGSYNAEYSKLGAEYFISKPLTMTSYPNYTTPNTYYGVKKTFNGSDSKGMFSIYSNAFKAWKKYKNKGYHLFDSKGKQLD